MKLLQRWQHLCLIISKGRAEIFFNGKSEIAGVMKEAKEILTEQYCILVLGQDQDSHGGGFDVRESFSGAIAEFTVVNRSTS